MQILRHGTNSGFLCVYIRRNILSSKADKLENRNADTYIFVQEQCPTATGWNGAEWRCTSICLVILFKSTVVLVLYYQKYYYVNRQ